MSSGAHAALLRCLRAAPEADRETLAQLFGFGYQVRRDDPEAAVPVSGGQTSADAPQLDLLQSLRPPNYWYLRQCRPEGEPAEPARERVLALEQADAAEEGEEALPPAMPFDPVWSPGQWLNTWDRLLPAQRQGREIDTALAVQTVSRAAPLDTLPKKAHKHWNTHTVLLLERTAALRPLWGDMEQARRSLLALLGDERFDCHILGGDPLAPWRRFGQGRGYNSGEEAIADAANVIAVGVFGGLYDGRADSRWSALFRRLHRRVHSLALLPACPLRNAAKLASHSIPLDGGRSTRLDLLLTLLSQVWNPELGHLRALRRAIPGACLHDELLAYNHDGVERDGPWLRLEQSLLSERLNRYENEVHQELKDHVQRLRRDWGRCFHTWVTEAEQLQCGLPQAPDPSRFPTLFRMARIWRDQHPDAASDAAAFSEQQLRALLPLAALLNDSPARDVWHDWLKVTQSVALRSGEKLPMRQEGLTAQAEAAGGRAFTQIHDQILLRSAPLLPLPDTPVQGYCVNTGRELSQGLPHKPEYLELLESQHRWRLEPMTRPPWAERIWRDRDGLFAGHEQGLVLQYREASPGQPEGGWQVLDNLWPWAADLGVDEYGLWVEIRLGGAGQRLRWIPPGQFMMGSPEEEPERRENEAQHEVILTQGYWLADTVCTQALWQAVMGKNPAHFKKDSQNPVEQVSWDDCQGFIQAANERLGGGLELRLPTEAEWEYACRAGSKGPFSWGDSLNTAQANYDGNRPYNDGSKGEYRGRTVPVRSFKPNYWGMFQMHGNVWEWCADWRGKYPDGAVVDPAGPEKGLLRVLRGGSWRSLGRFLRSANRSGNQPDDRYGNFGLRLAGGLDPTASQGASGMSADRRERKKVSAQHETPYDLL